MIPIIMKASESSLRSVPVTIKEAALALGAHDGVVARRVIIPTALPGLITAVLLAVSRAVGETAPILWVIGASTVNQLDPRRRWPRCRWRSSSRPPRRTLLSAKRPGESRLTLVVVVLILNLGSRLVAAWLQRERR